MSKRRPLVPDLELWTTLAGAIEPLRKRKRGRKAEPGIVEPAPAEASQSHLAPRAPLKTSRPPRRGPPPLGGLDRRTQRRLLRGDVEIEAMLDLHGESASTGRGRLLGFLAEATRRGRRTVLVITGKGGSPFARHTLHGVDHYHAPEREGRLRRLATEWLSEPEFRVHVAAYQPAHPRHGGGGAFYVRLRRHR